MQCDPRTLVSRLLAAVSRELGLCCPLTETPDIRPGRLR